MKPRDAGNWLRDLLDGEPVARTGCTVTNCLLLLSRAEISPNANIAKRCKGGVVKASRPFDVLRAE
jgi:hypothetical protein